MLDWLKARLSEPSTYAAIASGLALLKINVDIPTIASIVGGALALLGVFLPEKK